MFARPSLLVKAARHSQQHAASKRFFTSNNKLPNQWFGPKLKRLVAYSTVIGGAGGLAYYLAQDRDNFVDVFGAHEHVPRLALYPERGGPKNLPIAKYFIDDSVEQQLTANAQEKPRLVILGSGWGAVSVLKNLDKDKYNVIVVSDNNYFLFTPLLPSATVGTLELRSLLEPVRKIVARIRAHFVEGKAMDIDLNNKLVEVYSKNGEESFYIPYDKLVVAVGATGITHGIEGLQHTVQLKTIQDAIKIRHKVMENAEKACLPTTTPEERKRLLSFVVCGGGPTGVEFAAEVSDWINEDLVKWFPKLIREEISIHIIQSRDHILNTFDSKISDYAEKRFEREKVDVITNARVVEIKPGEVVYTVKADGSNREPVTKKLPYGLCLWSTGIAMTPFAQHITEKLPAQAHKRVLTTDEYLHLKGIEDESIFALGDCASIESPNLLEDIMELFEEGDADKDGTLQFKEFLNICDKIRRTHPLAAEHLTNLKKMFSAYDTDHSGTIDMEEMKVMLKDVNKKMTHLPATAQVASQQGKYLAKYLNQLVDNNEEGAIVTKNEATAKQIVGPFTYNYLGSLAYLGNTAVGDFKWGYQMVGGLWALYLWRSIYWSKQVSMRTRMNLSIDWTKCAVWGRDISTV